jgi:hypothetical protein
MIRDLTEIAALVAVGGALVVGCTADEPTCPEGDTECPTDGCPTDGCPTDGCPTDGCPTDGCPTDGCPTATSGFDPGYASSTDFFTLQTTGSSPGTTVHGDFRIYYSTDLQALIEAGGSFTAPVGATAIKEQFDDGGTLTQFSVMTKQAAGYDADNGDWHYETLSPDGMVTSEGAQAGCISCHVAAADTDYLPGVGFTN